MNDIKYIKNYVEKLYLNNDPSHDFEHIMRVYNNAEKICKTESVNKKLVLISVLLHDIVKKSHSKKSSKSSADLSAEKSLDILRKLNIPKLEIDIITEAIRNHSFTKKKNFKTPYFIVMTKNIENKMKELKSKGLNFNEITAELNKDGLSITRPTVQKKLKSLWSK